jgi:LysM repeat protein
LGEWLYCIGRAYNASPQAVIEANGLWWPYIIFPGQQLVIPNVTWVGMSAGPVCQPQFASPILPVFSSTALPATIIPVTIVPTTIAATAGVLASVTPIPSSACRAVHVVVPGDTLYRIGVSYGISYTEIARVNQISNARLIYSGQRLCIP